MAILQDGTVGSILARIFDTSKGLASMLVAQDGTTIPKSDGEARGATDGFLAIGGVNDENYRPARADRIGNLIPGAATLLFHEPFEGTTISSQRLTLASAMTTAQTAAGGLNMNSTGNTGSGNGVVINSNRRFARMQNAPLQVKIRARASHAPNAVIELGFGNTTSSASSSTIGAYWQITTGGVVQPVLTFNSVDVTGAAVTMPSGWQSNYYNWEVVVDDTEIIYTIQNSATGLIIAEQRIALPATQVRFWNATRLAVFAKLHNVTAPDTAANLILSALDVALLGVNQNKSWPVISAMNGFGSETDPLSFLQIINYTNSTAPTSATLSNTAAGYTTLGGQFQFAAVAGAETDYALFGFTAPAPYTFVCTGIEIDTFVTGAAIATTATVLQWFTSADQSIINLNAATNRRLALGVQNFLVGAAIGTAATAIVRVFHQSPLVTNPGRIFVIGLKIPIATATASQVIRGTVTVRGYFE